MSPVSHPWRPFGAPEVSCGNHKPQQAVTLELSEDSAPEVPWHTLRSEKSFSFPDFSGRFGEVLSQLLQQVCSGFPDAFVHIFQGLLQKPHGTLPADFTQSF